MHKYIQDVAYFIKCSSIWVKSSILVHYMLQMLHKWKCLNKNTMSVNVRLINVTCLKRAKQKHPLSCIKQNTD